jgi:abhydrolase domain-containing protein 6
MVQVQARFEREVLEGVPLDGAGTTVDSWVFRRGPLEGGAAARRIVLLHGLGDAPVSWFRALRSAFPDAEVLLPAIPGAGRGPLPAGVDHLGFHATTAWTAQVLHRLAATDRGVAVVGHSMGGWFLARALLADPSLTRRMGPPILVNNAGTWYDGVARERELLSPRTLEDVDELTMHLYARDTEIPIEALQALLDTMQAASYRGLLHSTTEGDFLRPEDLRRLPQGTGLVWGLEDRLVPPEALARLREHVPAVRFVPLDGVGHAPHIEAPERLVAALEGLL